jgi:hypothetical protein
LAQANRLPARTPSQEQAVSPNQDSRENLAELSAPDLDPAAKSEAKKDAPSLYAVGQLFLGVRWLIQLTKVWTPIGEFIPDTLP